MASILRLTFRLYHNRKIFAHDCLVIFGTLTLIPLTGVTYALLPRMYMVETINSDATVIPTMDELVDLLETPKWVFIFMALSWTTVFSIKFSFLIFFRPLIRNLSKKLDYYWWFSMIFCGVAYVLFAVEPAILCPHVGMPARTFFPANETTC